MNLNEEASGADDCSVDTIITDPPYALEFMGRGWDKVLPSVEVWCECLRVAKPGATLLSFGGTRTFHRLACNIEDAGWVIRDCLMWLYGSGFPKSHNIGFAVAKLRNEELKEVGDNPNHRKSDGLYELGFQGGKGDGKIREAQNEFSGWGTALKPAFEPVIVAMKACEGTFAENALKWGVSGLWIDGGRIGVEERNYKGSGVSQQRYTDSRAGLTDGRGRDMEFNVQGRFPSNVILDEEAARLLDQQSGELKSGFMSSGTPRLMSDNPNKNTYGEWKSDTVRTDTFGDSGGASRFFYVAKASRSERNKGCEDKTIPEYRWNKGGVCQQIKGTKGNCHPTVKPLKLMEYLCRLTKTPTGGVVLDPFMGSGTTGIAAYNTQRDFIGFELEEEYVKIAEARIKHYMKQQRLDNFM